MNFPSAISNAIQQTNNINKLVRLKPEKNKIPKNCNISSNQTRILASCFNQPILNSPSEIQQPHFRNYTPVVVCVTKFINQRRKTHEGNKQLPFKYFYRIFGPYGRDHK